MKRYVLLSILFCAFDCLALAETRTINAMASGTPINQGIRGSQYSVAFPLGSQEWVTTHMIEDLLYRTSARGPAEGGSSQDYDWRTLRSRLTGPVCGDGMSTLDWLRMLRDRDAEAIVTVNMTRVAACGDINDISEDINFLVDMASDWVYYMNHTLTTYRQGDTIQPGRDKDILDSLSLYWGTRDKLLASGEAPLKKVKYYEIGNETTDTNPDPAVIPGLVERYKLVSQAVLSEDPDAKVGPCAVESCTPYITAVLADPEAQVDFATYHPYGVMASTQWGVYPANPGDTGNPGAATTYLWNELSRQQTRHQTMVDAFVSNAYPATTPMACTEWNPGPWSADNEWKGATMAHAIACAETIFIYAHYTDGPIFAASYFLGGGWLRSPTVTPKYYMMKGLQDHLGDYLVDFRNGGANDDFRMYTTRTKDNDKIVIWGLNFRDDTNKQMTISLQNMPFTPIKITFMKLGKKDGSDTRLFDYIPENTPEQNATLGWTETDMTGLNLSNFALTFEDATISALVIEKYPRDCNAAYALQVVPAGDISGDCKIDLQDINLLAQKWLTCDVPGNSDCEITWVTRDTIINYDFENGLLNGWTGSNSKGVTYSLSVSSSSQGNLGIPGAAVGSKYLKSQAYETLKSGSFPVQAGVYYSGSFYYCSETNMRFTIDWYDQNSTLISSTLMADLLLNSQGWHLYVFTDTIAPPTASSAKLRFNNCSTNFNFYAALDEVAVTKPKEVLPQNCIEAWQAGGGMKADLNQDCTVDIADFARLAQDWLKRVL